MFNEFNWKSKVREQICETPQMIKILENKIAFQTTLNNISQETRFISPWKHSR